MTTHLIVGLGESEEDMAEIIAACVERNITVGLFAFTPVKGTVWASRLPPDIGHYRRIQIAHQLFKAGYGRTAVLYREKKIVGFSIEDLKTVLAGGAAFQTSGCPDCNRPFYNERPGGVMYNYPGPLTPEEFAGALSEAGIFGEENHEMAGN
jgi:biotin synthase